MPAAQTRTVRVALALLAIGLVLLVWWWASESSTGEAGARAGAGSSSSSSSSAGAARPGGSGASPAKTVQPRDTSGLASVTVADLPREAQRTLDLISAGGPYPYSRDGVVFQNRERLLPRKTSGYYREYTVPTPGEHDRGARRIITGKSGERYWTADHYASFRVIEGGAR
ncbi:MAG: ribonuclease domain-containing protein [Pedococcus sp.]